MSELLLILDMLEKLDAGFTNHQHHELHLFADRSGEITYYDHIDRHEEVQVFSFDTISELTEWIYGLEYERENKK